MKRMIEAEDYEFSELFKRATNIQLVPTLQRPYTWGETEVKKFLTDIVENPPGYYIGSVVLVAAQGSSKRDEIIDGQQRFTTLNLILIAIRSVMKQQSINNSDVEADILDYLIMPQHKSEGVVRLAFTNEKSNQVFENLVFGKELPDEMSETQQMFVKNYEIIKSQISKLMSEKEGFIDDLMERTRGLQLIYISCFDKSAAYTLFESINATGLSLASMDLIKSGIFSRLSGDANKLEVAEQNWLSLEETFNEDRGMLKTFLRHEWISNGKYTSHEKIYSEFVSTFSGQAPDRVEEYLLRLGTASGVYSALRGAKVDWLYDKKNFKGEVRFNIAEVKETLEFLSYLGVDQVYSVLLNVFQKKKKIFRKELVKLTAFQFLFKYLPGSPSTVERKFAEFCTSGDVNKLNSELLKMCVNKKDDFVEKYLEKAKYVEGSSGDLQYVLQKLADRFDRIPAFKKPTIEHIIPRKPEERPNSLKQLKKTDYKKLVNSLGNLTVVEYKDNSSSKKLGNNAFTKKKKYFKASGRKTHLDILLFENNFTNAPGLAIKDRGTQLANDIYDTFLIALQVGKFA